MAPICMFNALWFDPDGGAERYMDYGRAVLPVLDAVGADVLVPFLPVEAALEGGVDPDVIGFVRYPSAEAFDEMWRGETYGEVAPLRSDALSNAVLTRCQIDPPDAAPVTLEPGVVVVNMLWFDVGGAARYDEYLAAAQPLVEQAGGHLVSPRLHPDRAYEGDVVPDLVLLGWYPSMDAVRSMVMSEDYQAPARLRTDALRHSATTILRITG